MTVNRLEIHPAKTRIVYCKDANRRMNNKAPKEFKFLGFVFKQRETINTKSRKVFMNFLPAIGDDTLKEMRRIIKFQWKIGLQVHKSLEDIALEVNPIIRGWINFYGKFNLSRLKTLAYYIDKQLMKWARNKYETLRGQIDGSRGWLKSVYNMNSKLFSHWDNFPVY